MRRDQRYPYLRYVFLAISFGCAAPVACASGVTTEGEQGGGGDGGSSSQSSSSGSSGPCQFAEDCTSFTDACNIGACINAACAKIPMNEGAGCDDGKTCTEGDHCVSGACTGDLKYCPSTDSCHVGQCDVESDSCIEVPGNNGAPCIDDDPCTATSTCNNGMCAPGKATDCSFLNGACSIGSCDPAVGCVALPKNNGAKCDDGFFCTVDDTCTAGVCGGVPNVCAAPGNVCLIGTCNEANDSCVAVPGNDGAACDDNSICTTGETCSNGACNGGAAQNDGMACNDKNACTTGETCSNGACTAGAAVVACADGDGCCPPGCALNNDNDCGGAVYLSSMGGMMAPLYRYDVQTNTWSNTGSLPKETWSQLTTDGTHIYVLGVDNTIYSFDPGTKVWTQAGTGPGFQSGQPYGFFKWTPQGFYYIKDGELTIQQSNGAAWSSMPLPAPGSIAGSFDPSSSTLYIRIYGSSGLMVFDVGTNTVTSTFQVPFMVQEASRTGSYYNGYFYTRDVFDAFQKMDVSNGLVANTGATPFEVYTSTDSNLATGDIYIGGYKPTGTTFQVYNAGTNIINTLAPVPGFVIDSTVVVSK